MYLDVPPWSRLLAPGVFKPSCYPFTLFLRLVSVYRPFQLYFIPKTLHNTSVFSSLLTAYFCLTGHSPVFIYNTTLLYKILLVLCGHLQTQRVCRALHPGTMTRTRTRTMKMNAPTTVTIGQGFLS